MTRGLRREPPPDLRFAPAEREIVEAETGRLRQALEDAGLRPQGPGFPFVHWRRSIGNGLVAGLPKGASWTAASVSACLAAFGRQREDISLYVRIPFSHVTVAPTGSFGVDVGILHPVVREYLAAADALVPDFLTFARALARAQPSDVSNWRLT